MQQSTPIGRIAGRVVAILVAFALACAGVIAAQRPSHALYFLDKGMHIPISVGAQESGQGFWFGPWASPQGVPGENVWCIEMWKYNPEPEDSATLSKMSGPRSFTPADLKVTNSQAAWLLDKYQPTLDKRHGAALGFLIHQNFDQDNPGHNTAQDVKTMYNDVKRLQPDILSLAQAMATEARNSGGFNAKDATVTGEGTREGAILNTAMQIVDDGGIDALTMRRLGRDLGVDPMMIYRHFSNKVAVLDGLMEVMWRDVTVAAATQTTPSWREHLVAVMHTLRRALLRHPRAISIVGTRPATGPELFALMERLLTSLAEAGMPVNSQAADQLNALVNYTVGHVLAEAGEPVGGEADQMSHQTVLPASFPHLAAVFNSGWRYDADRQYDDALRAMVYGWSEATREADGALTEGKSTNAEGGATASQAVLDGRD